MAFIKQTGFSPGNRYTVQVRAKSRTDKQRVSDWSNAYTFTTSNDTVPPEPVKNLEMEPEGSSFIAEWDAPTKNADGTSCTDLAGYRVHFYNTDDEGEVTREVFTPDESFNLSFEDNKNMFIKPRGGITIVVVAIDHMGNRSEDAEAEAENPPPADVTGLEATAGIENISLNWDANEDDDDLVGYKVYESVSGKSFEPGPGNIKYTGPGTSFVLPTSNPVPHHFKVRAYDIFGLESKNDAYAVETPKTTTGQDGQPPEKPTNFEVESLIDGSSVDIKLSWSDPGDNDLDHILIRYSIDNADWSYAQAPEGAQSAVIHGVKQDTDYYIAIKSYDFTGNNSSWVNASPYPYKTDKNEIAPNKPSKPQANKYSGGINIVHDLKDTSGTSYDFADQISVYRLTGASANTSQDDLLAKQKVNNGDIFASVFIPMVGDSTSSDFYVTITNAYDKTSDPSDTVSANPDQLTGSNIEDASIGNAKISNLDANKLNANSAFVNDLYIRSDLTIDDTDGLIKSSNYNASNKTGWKIDKNGITLNEGIVRANTMEIQSSPNICPPEYSGFEFNKVMYSDSDDEVNANYLSVSNSATRVKLSVDSKYGNQSLQVKTPSSSGVELTLGSDYTTDINALQKYIVSAYVKNTESSSASYKIKVDTNDSNSFESAAKSITDNDGFVRLFVDFKAGSQDTKVAVKIVKTSSGSNTYLLDAVQIENQIGALSEPSNYSPPGFTQLNGAGITTGSIQSSAPAIGVQGQPAWSLNTQGNMQVGDALVRGNLVVGAGSNAEDSVVKSSDFQSGVSGWVIRGDGYAEFNNGKFRSELLVERYISAQDITLRLRGSLEDNIVYINGNVTKINSPMISGEHYAYDRIKISGGYLPSQPNKNKKMNFYMGPSVAKNFMIQTSEDDLGGLYGSRPPDNVLLNTLSIGDQLDFTNPQVVREPAGFKHQIYINGNADTQYHNLSHKGGAVGTKNKFINENYASVESITNIRSPFYPQSNDIQTYARDYYSNSQQSIKSQSTYHGPSRNLIPSPFDYMMWSDSFNDNNSENNIGNRMLVLDNFHVSTGAAALFGDKNYRVPAVIIKGLSPIGSNTGQDYIYFIKNSRGANNDPNEWADIGLKPNTEYVLSMYVKSDYANSPTSDWTLGFYLKMGTGGQSKYVHREERTVKYGSDSVRISAKFTTPSNADGRALASFFTHDTRVRNKRFAISRPQLEEVIWRDSSNPDIANSDSATAWTSSENGTHSESRAELNVITASTADFSYDAYGRYDSDFGDFAAEDLKTYREAPGYIDMVFDRKSYKLNRSNNNRIPYRGDKESVKFRFSEAGIMQPGAYEPMRPAGVEFKIGNVMSYPGVPQVLGDYNKITDSTSYGYGSTIPGKGDIRPSSSGYELEIMRTGFYLIHAGANIREDNGGTSGDANLFMTFELNGEYTFHAQGAPRINTDGFNAFTMVFIRRGDYLVIWAHNAPTNGGNFDFQSPRIAVTRIS